MPTYEYHCPKCKSTYELRQGFSAETTHTCEECGKGVAKRILHAPKVHFKGSGFYATDSKSKSSAVSDNKPAAGTESTEPSAGSRTASAPAETASPASSEAAAS
ncbi:MAG: FmdB family transcriptional regulator [Anaerolinea sp.]|nr:FmdB family transcriptional regulator [Anaerolinea sp.]